MNNEINIETAKQFYIDMLSGELPADKQEMLNTFLQDNPSAAQEFEMFELIWKATDIQRRPSRPPIMSEQLQQKLKDAALEEDEDINLNFNN